MTLAHLPPIGWGMRGGGSGGGSQQREVADGANVVFTDTSNKGLVNCQSTRHVTC